jgi:hypothetical protein
MGVVAGIDGNPSGWQPPVNSALKEWLATQPVKRKAQGARVTIRHGADRAWHLAPFGLLRGETPSFSPEG